MTLTSDTIHVSREIGGNVIMQIPDVDRGKAVLRNIVGVVLQKNDQGFHKIETQYGMLDKLYCRYVLYIYVHVLSEFDKCKDKFLHEEDVPNINLPLGTVTKEADIGTGKGFMRCVCMKGCMTKRCLCMKNGYLCNSKCHDSLSCNNK
ncbi:unnamed protein product [Parnassius mnemosyne]|uniref:KRAB-A domain-containing 2-like n=1 Tax=Parnassius mnemosyne TaxID=213953 RepID=A0AAV1M7X1_9NEOP